MSLKSVGRSRHRMMSEINVVPYIDVMLVLVVILMVAAPFVNPSIVNLPSVHKASAAPQKTVEVVVHADGKISVKDHGKYLPVALPALAAQVKSTQGETQTPVVISADRDVRYEQVIDVMKNLQKAEVGRIGLALQVEKGSR